MTRLGVLTAGGMNVYLLNLANSLGSFGHRVDIFTRVHQENDESVLKPHPNVRIIHLSTSESNLVADTEYFAKKLIDFIARESILYDVLHAHYFYSGIIGKIVRAKYRFPLTQTFHTLSRMKEHYGGLGEKTREKKEKEIVQYTDSIIASTEIEKQDLITYYGADPKKITVVSPGVNHKIFKKYDKKLAREKLHLAKDKYLILFVGRIDPIKGIHFLIEAISRLHDSYPSFVQKVQVLLIGGDISNRQFWQNPEVKKISQLISSKKLTCCVSFLGSSPHHMLPYYYSASDIVVMPSIYESFGFVALEAMSCGSTVVASKVGGLMYLIRDHQSGRLFGNGNVGQLSQVIQELLSNKKQRTQLGIFAQIASLDYSWERQAKCMLEAYRKING